MFRVHQHFFFAALLALTRLPCAAASVRIVDTSGAPGTFASIQAACDQSIDGDVVLVRSGTYASFALVNKGVTVSAYPGATVHVTGGIRIRNLAVNKTAVLIGLLVDGVQGLSPNSEHGLAATSDHGHVRSERCEFHGYGPPLAGSGDGAAGVLVDDCDDVALTTCSCAGGTSAPSFGSYTRGGAGVLAIASGVTLFDSTLTGGAGQYGNPTVAEGGSGGHGYAGRDSTLFASKVVFQGGRGGDGTMFGVTCGYGFPGYGGNALHLDSPGDLVRLVSPTELPGYEGNYLRSFCVFVPGTPAAAREGNPSSFVDLPVSARSLTIAANPIREGAPVAATLSGLPGDPVALIVSFTTASQFNPAWNGQQMFPLLSTTRFLVIGTVPASGILSYLLNIPPLGPGVDSKLFFVQPLFGASGGQRVLGSSVPMLVLDSSL